MRWFLAIFLVMGQAIGAAAQDDDKGRLTKYLEQALSELGREVQITGFKGALSSHATMDRLTIADDTGVWLVLTDVVLDWNRAAVLRGRIEINELSAARIDLPRMPSSGDPVSPEAGTFALPELPVSLRIDAIKMEKVVLGEPVFGTPATVAVTGSVSLADGQGMAKLAITRLEGPQGAFRLDAAYSNATRVLAIDLSLQEAANGISANLLNLPGKPALELSISGNSVIDDFVADIVLKSNGQQRLTGSIGTQATQGPASGVTPTRVIQADISGDLTPLFLPQYQAFFGSDVALSSRISLFADGRTSLDTLVVNSATLRVTGTAVLSADGLPEHFELNAVLQDPTGDLVLLPMPGPETRVKSATIAARFDNRIGDAWNLTGNLQGLQRSEVNLDTLDLTANGVIQKGESDLVTARIEGAARGVDLTDPGLAAALGSVVTLGADIRWRDGQPLDFKNLTLGAQGLALSGTGTVGGLSSAVSVKGALQAQVADLSRFSALVGLPIAGGIDADLTGSLTLLTGEADLVLTAVATNLKVGIPNVDTALAGESHVNLSVLRHTEGLTLRAASITTTGGEAEAKGLVSTGQSDLQFKASLKNVGQFIDGLSGPVRLTGQAIEDGSGWTVGLDAEVPDAINFSAKVNLPASGSINAKVDANIGSVAWIVPGLTGPARIAATVVQAGDQWTVDAQADGPGNSRVKIAGQIAGDARTATLTLNGTMPLALLNRQLKPNSAQGNAQFDLQLDGPLAVSSLSGKVRTSGARLSLPGLRNAFTDIGAVIDLAGSSAEIRATSSVATGGQLLAQGRVGLQPPYTADLALQVTNVKITDTQLFQTRINGALSLGGATPGNLKLSGRLVLDKIEILVPSTGIDGFADIPKIVHLNEPAKVRRTRSFAGLLDTGAAEGAGGGPAVGLDVQIIAENRIFIRGRGLDAELGGQLRLTGTTADIIPQGHFELIRGRLSILGKRLNLQEGSAQLQGALMPILRLVARTTVDDAELFVIVEGPADAPEVSFVSKPEAPSDEVLGRLLFGRKISEISALQAVQLASAVATLAGRGGIGIVERLRQSTGLDDIDLATDDEGGSSLRLGKYIGKNAYTEVEIGADGQSRINLNLDLTPSAKLRGQVGTDGETGIGLFFERDY
ncbi:MAG: translocation/assembly module TamB domain-containing protein [Rhodobacteraceae bacterium]|nr:translocation/assembly module TamB domain-containing protein [Paracoccaceae bacterium]